MSELVPTRPVRVVQGRVVVTVTPDDVVAARLSRPTVRLAVYAAGVAHALRPESRDRITALMRREYKARRRTRVRAARRAYWRAPVAPDAISAPALDVGPSATGTRAQ